MTRYSSRYPWRLRLHLLLVGILPVLAAGCATLVNDDTMEIEIVTNPSGARVRMEGERGGHGTPAKVSVARSDRELHITVSNDTLRRSIVVEPSFSREYLLGNLLTYWIGGLIDMSSDRRFAYDEVIYIDMADTLRGYPRHRHGLHREGQIRLGGTIPFLQFVTFGLDTGDITTGMGLAGSLDYFHGDGAFLSLSLGGASEIGECFDSLCSPHSTLMFASLAHGHNWRYGWLSYGLQVARAGIGLRGESRAPMVRSELMAGPTVSAGLHLLGALQVVVTYAPALYSSSRGLGLGSERSISFGFWLMSAEGSPF